MKVLSAQHKALLLSDAYEELHRFHIPGFVGYAARLPKDLLGWLMDHHDVDFIEQDRKISINAVQEHSPAWGLNRISRRELTHGNDSSAKTYTYPDSAGTGVDAYIIDTVDTIFN